jgi:hypothetical protein
MKKFKFVFGLTALFVLMLACANPLGGNAPAAPENVETIVAATLQALTASAPDAGAAPPESTPGLLPHSMYFLNNDSAGLMQVFRLEKDGKTVTQLTFEPAKVETYDASRLDGSVAYVSNNQLLLINSDGSNRRLLVDGGAVDENNPYLTKISNPVFSPDNQTIAFGRGGLTFYSLATGQSNLVVKNDFQDFGGNLVPMNIYWPESYSADGQKIVITIAHYEGATAAIYYLNGGALVQLQGGQGALICCGETEWTADGSAFYAASPSLGMFSPGLWRVDAATGTVTTLLSGEYDANPINLADEPFLAPDGQLYFFHATAPAGLDFTDRSPLQLVRTAADGMTNRTVLRPETYELLNEALWAPDGSFVIAAVAPVREIYQGGEARLIYTDGQKSIVPLVPFAQNMKWGP